APQELGPVLQSIRWWCLDYRLTAVEKPGLHIFEDRPCKLFTLFPKCVTDTNPYEQSFVSTTSHNLIQNLLIQAYIWGTKAYLLLFIFTCVVNKAWIASSTLLLFLTAKEISMVEIQVPCLIGNLDILSDDANPTIIRMTTTIMVPYIENNIVKNGKYLEKKEILGFIAPASSSALEEGTPHLVHSVRFHYGHPDALARLPVLVCDSSCIFLMKHWLVEMGSKYSAENLQARSMLAVMLSHVLVLIVCFLLMLYKITICISQRFWTLGDEITDMLSIIPNIGRIIMKCPDLNSNKADIARHPFHAYQIIIK
ncbi:hypothetical protein ACJX0J_005987, partial [Zea mays]